MSPPSWTPAQLDAITARGGELLVSAGAGSGKTSALVERLIGLTVDAANPVGLDRILAVTFTEEAAGEMRQRVRAALHSRLSQPGANVHLRRQLALIDRAPISTIHAFCYRLIREHFHLLGLDPRAEAMDAEEARLLQLETLDAVFDARHEDDSPRGRAFVELAERYGGRQSDAQLREIVLNLHRALENVLDPEEWMERAVRSYEEPEPWLAAWRDALATDLSAAADTLRAAFARLRAAKVPSPYIDGAHQDLTTAAELARGMSEKPLDEALSMLRRCEFASVRKSSKWPIEQVVAADDWLETRNLWKKSVSAAAAFQPDAARAVIRRMAPHVAALFDLVREFQAAFAAAKDRQSLLDFSDLERRALQLLRAPDGSPTATAQSVQRRFEHVIVDEYQDINPVQEAILSLTARPDAPNRFLVGDVKQCIYGFRSSDPGIFLNKLVDCEKAVSSPSGRAIFLAENFRSRPEILDAVNAVFARIFAPPLGGMRYGDREALRPGADIAPDNAAGPPVECVILSREARPGREPAESEAREIGERLLEWTGRAPGGELLVRDRDSGLLRPARFSDAAILLRAMRGRAGQFADTLRAMGVPVALPSEAAFFESTEIADILSLLRVLDNPRQDIPLAATLRSPLFNLTEEQLARIRIACPELPFHEAAALCAESSDMENLTGAFDTLDEWRDAARMTPLADLLRRICEESGYLDAAGGLPDGEMRRARLESLIERARLFGASGRPTLARFLRYIEDLAERRIELDAPPPPPAEDAARMMSIHQSKGLEFPIVFVADLAHRFNFLDARGAVIVDREGGLGLQEIDLERGERRPTIPQRIAARRASARARAEEARLLYVAMTRARDRLVLTASVKTEEAWETWSRRSGDPATPLPADVLSGAMAPIDWLGPILAGFQLAAGQSLSDDGEGLLERPAMRLRLEAAPETPAGVSDAPDPLSRRNPNGAWFDRLQDNQPLVDDWRGNPAAVKVARRLAWRYPHAGLAHAPAKVTVTGLKSRLQRFEEEGETVLEDFYPVHADSGTLDPRARGTLLHAILRHLDLSVAELTQEEIARQAARMAERGQIDADALPHVDLRPLAGFFASDRGRALRASLNRLERETAFTWKLPASVLELGLDSEAGREIPVTVQGIVDALLDGPAGLTIIDFKTDVIGRRQLQEAAESYRPQMALYAQALTAIRRRPLAEAVLVFLAIEEEYAFDPESLLAWRPEA